MEEFVCKELKLNMGIIFKYLSMKVAAQSSRSQNSVESVKKSMVSSYEVSRKQLMFNKIWLELLMKKLMV